MGIQVRQQIVSPVMRVIIMQWLIRIIPAFRTIVHNVIQNRDGLLRVLTTTLRISHWLEAMLGKVVIPVIRMVIRGHLQIVLPVMPATITEPIIPTTVLPSSRQIVLPVMMKQPGRLPVLTTMEIISQFIVENIRMSGVLVMSATRTQLTIWSLLA